MYRFGSMGFYPYFCSNLTKLFNNSIKTPLIHEETF